MDAFSVTDNLDAVNRALAATGGKRRVDKVLDGSGFGFYCTMRYRTTRGGHVLIRFVEMNAKVYVKSVLSVTNKNKPARCLSNGQPGTNTKLVNFYAEGEGPVVE